MKINLDFKGIYKEFKELSFNDKMITIFEASMICMTTAFGPILSILQFICILGLHTLNKKTCYVTSCMLCIYIVIICAFLGLMYIPEMM